jgi:predicted metal-binding protein
METILIMISILSTIIYQRLFVLDYIAITTQEGLIYIYIALIMSVVRFECTEIKVESYSKTRINKILIGVSRSLQIYP